MADNLFLKRANFNNLLDGTTQGQMTFWDDTQKKWVYAETSEMSWDDTGKILTFGNFPITPSSAPTTDYQVSNKKYVDDNSAKLDDGTADGQMTFWNGTSWTNTATSELFWDDTNKRVGIGTDSPTEKLDVNGKIALNGTQVAYLPTAYTGTLILGDGGGSLDTGADYNTFVGIGAGFNNTTGYSNTANGSYSLYANTTGYRNTANGSYSLRSNTTGNYNTANGYLSLYANTTGDNNTASGYYSLHSNTTGDNNTANGMYSLRSNTTGNYNFGLGYNAGRYIAGGTTPNETGSYNIFIGANTKALADGDINEMVIGNNAVGLGSNSVVLGNDDIVTTALKGNVGIGTDSPTEKLEVNGTVKATSYKSSDGSAGITQSETGVTDFDIVIKNGLITSFTKN